MYMCIHVCVHIQLCDVFQLHTVYFVYKKSNIHENVPVTEQYTCMYMVHVHVNVVAHDYPYLTSLDSDVAGGAIILLAYEINR